MILCKSGPRLLKRVMLQITRDNRTNYKPLLLATASLLAVENRALMTSLRDPGWKVSVTSLCR